MFQHRWFGLGKTLLPIALERSSDPVQVVVLQRRSNFSPEEYKEMVDTKLENLDIDILAVYLMFALS